ncbi:MAG: hypothetical protein AMJ59_24090 [Gammaproteobacteria bacterium SG8_31]|nr:MAG: hypothetical protein AMJ59_24090 [Gammaproteobacteria bacterium SG8_31]
MERNRVGVIALLEQLLHLLFGCSECLLAGARKLDPALKGLQGLFQTQVPLFHFFYQLFKFLERFFEIRSGTTFLDHSEYSPTTLNVRGRLTYRGVG